MAFVREKAYQNAIQKVMEFITLMKRNVCVGYKSPAEVMHTNTKICYTWNSSFGFPTSWT